MDVLPVLSWERRVDQYVIQVDDHKIVQQIPGHILHEVHEDPRRIGQAKGHHHGFDVAITYPEDCLLLPHSDLDQIIGFPQVQFGGILGLA